MSLAEVMLRISSASALVALNGFFVAVEFAVVAARRPRLQQLAAGGSAAARVALDLINHPDRVIAASQLGITMASLALGWIGEATIAAIIEPGLHRLLGGWSEVAAHTIGVIVSFTLVTFAHIVLGEQVPKTIAIRSPEKTSLTVSRPMRLFMRVFRPLVALLDWVTAAVLRVVNVRPMSGHHAVYSPEELKLILRDSQKGGALEADQEEMLQKVFRFADMQVNEVMVPRPDVVGIDAQATLTEFLALFAEESHARFPVFDDDLDNVVGMVSIKDVLRALADDPAQNEAPIGLLARPALYVPETVAVADLFDDMRASRNQMAIVLDEYSGMAGIVTLEELVEEIVGRLSDELVSLEEAVVQIDADTAEVDAQLRIDEINLELDLDLPEGEEYETLAGLVLYRLQRVPAVGDELKQGDLVLTVQQMRGPKIEKIRIRRKPEATGGTAGSD